MIVLKIYRYFTERNAIFSRKNMHSTYYGINGAWVGTLDLGGRLVRGESAERAHSS